MIDRNPMMLASAAAYKNELLNTMFGSDVTVAFSVAAPTAAGCSIPKSSNVLGVGYGTKETLGENLPSDVAIRVYVRAKLPRAGLSKGERVPEQINGVPTDVVPVGDLAALVKCGSSVGHFAITAGTAGCLVARAGDPATYVLSNNHVLANATDVHVGLAGGPAAVGDDVLQPAPMDGGIRPGDVVASLSSWVPLDFSGHGNDVDAAIAEVTTPAHFERDLIKIGPVVAPTMTAALYQSVRKWGRTTNHTVGVVVDLAASIRVRYGTQSAWFVDQLGISGVGAPPFSQGGDSGSLVVDAVSRRPVGLLFAGGGSMTYANVIDDVLSHPDIAATIL